MNKQTIVGIDEVGRGCVAGTVLAAAVYWDEHAFSLENLKKELKDSKKLSEKKRIELYEKICVDAKIPFGMGQATVGIINAVGIDKAALYAMHQAFNDLRTKFHGVDIDSKLIIIDGNQKVPGLKNYNQKAIVKADDKIPAVMAASIIAKVSRDAIMDQLHQLYPQYDWDKNKGYCTQAHTKAIQKYGVIPLIHRDWPKYYERIGVKYVFSR